MANENLFRAILELDVEFSKTSKGLDEVAAQYGKVNKAAEQNQKKLQELANDEAKILEARKKANNPSVIVKYNNELKNVQGQIKAITAEQNKLSQAEKTTAKEADNLNKSLKNAFTTTQLNAMKKELKALGVEFSSVSNGAKKFLSDTAKGIQEPVNRFTQLKSEIKAAKGELATAFSSGNQAAIQAASQKVGKLKDEFDDLNDASKQFASGSKFQVIGNVFGDISRKLIDLDFEGAADRSRALVQATKAITFKDAITGIGQLGTTLLNIGKSLLMNPIFLIGAAVAGTISLFNSFTESAKRTEEVLKGIDEAINEINDDTQELIRTNRDLALQNKIDAGEIQKVNGEKLKAQNRFKDEYLAIVKKTQEAQKKLNEETEKAREEDQFKGSKKLFEFLGGETELTKNQKEGLKRIQEAHNKEISVLQEKFRLENSKILIDEVNEQEKKRKEANDKLKQFLENEFNIRKSFLKRLSDADKANTEFNIKNREQAGSNKQITEEFEVKKLLIHEETQAQIEELNKQRDEAKKAGLLTLDLKRKFSKDEQLIFRTASQELINLNQERELALIENDTKLAQESLERNTAHNTLLLEQSEDTEIGIARQKLLIQTDYYDQSIKLLEQDIAKRKDKAFDTTTQEKALTDLKLKAQTESIKGFDELNKLETDAAIKSENMQESQAETQLKLQNRRNSTILASELEFERDKLEILRQGGKAYETEAKAQADKVALLEKETLKQRRLENISYYEQISQAAIAATNKIIDTKIKEIEAQTNLQQKRVDEAKGIADQGNAELLELEKERLDNLNKEKEKFVRAQQALAAIELISNTAIAVSKAAAEGGAAAGITIAAALLALVAGLASARSIASQAAFYEGGYTGDGNPRETSTALGRKNYTYHKGEFVFDHEKTGKYRKIFEDVHNDRVDLGEMRDKALMYDYFKNLTSMNTQVPIFMPPSVVNNTVEIKELRGQMSELINVVKNQQTSISLDKRGFYGSLKNVVDRDNFLSKEAKA